MVMTQSFVDVPEREIRLFVRSREGTDKSKPPLVLLHGWPASSRGWEPVVDALPTDRRVLCPDLRGLGQSERRGPVDRFAKQELAKDIISLLNVLNVEGFVVAGQDWGGSAAQEIALMLPQRTKQLIVMNINLINNPSGNMRGLKAQMLSPENPRWYMAFQSAPGLAESMIPGSEDQWIRYFFEKGAGPDAVFAEDILASYIEDYARPDTPRCGASYYRSMMLDAGRWAGLGGTRFTQPSLLLYGDQDPFLTPEFYTDYQTCFDDVTKVDLPGGHFIQDEKPLEVANAIAQFLRD
ncbi:MAG: alpha/beta hydrolase [Pseudomonadota bacterium]